jgi:hypothetical protein
VTLFLDLIPLFTLCPYVTKMESNFNFWAVIVFIPKLPTREFLGFYLLSLFCQQKCFQIRDSIFPRLSEFILQEYLSRKEMAEQGKMCNEFLKEGNNLVKQIF